MSTLNTATCRVYFLKYRTSHCLERLLFRHRPTYPKTKKKGERNANRSKPQAHTGIEIEEEREATRKRGKKQRRRKRRRRKKKDCDMEMRRNQKVSKHDFANPKPRQNSKQRRHGERNRQRGRVPKAVHCELQSKGKERRVRLNHTPSV